MHVKGSATVRPGEFHTCLVLITEMIMFCLYRIHYLDFRNEKGGEV